MKIKCTNKIRFIIYTILTIFLAILPKKILYPAVIKQLDKIFNIPEYRYTLLSSGRSALACLLNDIKSKGYNTILLPDYICNVVYEAARYCGMMIIPYKTDDNYKVFIPDIIEKLTENCCILFASYLGRSQNYTDIVRKIRSIKPNTIIIYDECQNIIGANKITLDYNSHIILSFNNKITPGLLGGAIVSLNKNYTINKRNIFSDFKYNVVCFLAYIKYNLLLLYTAITGKYPEPKAIEISSCNGKYSVEPTMISSISLAAAFMSLKNLTFHQKVLLKNDEFLINLQERGIIFIQEYPDIKEAPYIPVLINKDINISLPLKGRYGLDNDCRKENACLCFMKSNFFIYKMKGI